MKTRREKILERVTIVVVIVTFVAGVNYYCHPKAQQKEVPTVAQTNQAENAWGVVPTSNQPEVAIGFVREVPQPEKKLPVPKEMVVASNETVVTNNNFTVDLELKLGTK